MQPRRECECEPGRVVFQVTNKGYSASGSVSGRECVLGSGVVAVVLGAREAEEDEDEDEGVDKPLGERAESRSKAGLRRELVVLDGAEEPAVSSSSSSS